MTSVLHHDENNENVICYKDSLECIRKVLRCGLSTVAYNRGLFPSRAFKKETYNNTWISLPKNVHNNNNNKNNDDCEDAYFYYAVKIKPKHAAHVQFHEWINGALQGIRQKIISEVILLLESADGEHVLESYSWKFKYNNQSGDTFISSLVGKNNNNNNDPQNNYNNNNNEHRHFSQRQPLHQIFDSNNNNNNLDFFPSNNHGNNDNNNNAKTVNLFEETPASRPGSAVFIPQKQQNSDESEESIRNGLLSSSRQGEKEQGEEGGFTVCSSSAQLDEALTEQVEMIKILTQHLPPPPLDGYKISMRMYHCPPPISTNSLSSSASSASHQHDNNKKRNKNHRHDDDLLVDLAGFETFEFELDDNDEEEEGREPNDKNVSSESNKIIAQKPNHVYLIPNCHEVRQDFLATNKIFSEKFLDEVILPSQINSTFHSASVSVRSAAGAVVPQFGRKFSHRKSNNHDGDDDEENNQVFECCEKEEEVDDDDNKNNGNLEQDRTRAGNRARASLMKGVLRDDDDDDGTESGNNDNNLTVQTSNKNNNKVLLDKIFRSVKKQVRASFSIHRHNNNGESNDEEDEKNFGVENNSSSEQDLRLFPSNDDYNNNHHLQSTEERILTPKFDPSMFHQRPADDNETNKKATEQHTLESLTRLFSDKKFGIGASGVVVALLSGLLVTSRPLLQLQQEIILQRQKRQNLILAYENNNNNNSKKKTKNNNNGDGVDLKIQQLRLLNSKIEKFKKILHASFRSCLEILHALIKKNETTVMDDQKRFELVGIKKSLLYGQKNKYKKSQQENRDPTSISHAEHQYLEAEYVNYIQLELTAPVLEKILHIFASDTVKVVVDEECWIYDCDLLFQLAYPALHRDEVVFILKKYYFSLLHHPVNDINNINNNNSRSDLDCSNLPEEIQEKFLSNSLSISFEEYSSSNASNSSETNSDHNNDEVEDLKEKKSTKTNPTNNQESRRRQRTGY